MIKKVLKNLVMLGLLLAVAGGVFGYVKDTQTTAYRVATGSMTPTIGVGNVVVVQPQAEYRKGDIITFITHDGKTITHRIAEVKPEGYVTKGDANNHTDVLNPDFTKSHTIGKVVVHFPCPSARTMILISIIIIAGMCLVSVVRGGGKDKSKE